MDHMNEATLEAPVPVKEATDQEITLTAHDRCDSCGSQAYVAVLFETGELDFCAHHYHEYEGRIGQIAVRITDERWQLTGQRLDVSA